MRTKSHAHYHGALYFLLPPPPLLTPDLFTALRFNQETRREDRRIFEPRYLSRIKSKDQQSLPFSLAISVYLKIHSYIYIFLYKNWISRILFRTLSLFRLSSLPTERPERIFNVEISISYLLENKKGKNIPKTPNLILLTREKHNRERVSLTNKPTLET